jgi:hypothetical protein
LHIQHGFQNHPQLSSFPSIQLYHSPLPHSCLVGSPDHRGWHIGKVEAQDNQWYSSSLSLEAWGTGEQMVWVLVWGLSSLRPNKTMFQFGSEVMESLISNSKQSCKKKFLYSSLYSCRFLIDWMRPLPTIVRREIYLTSDSNVSFTQNTLKDTSRIMLDWCLGTSWPNQVDV